MSSKVVVVQDSDRMGDTEHGFIRGWGISGKTTGANSISMAHGVLPSGIKAEPHYHPFETAIYILAGKVRVFFGDDEEEFVDVMAGDFVYIPAGVVHSPMNIEQTPMEYVVARNAPEEISHPPQTKLGG